MHRFQIGPLVAILLLGCGRVPPAPVPVPDADTPPTLLASMNLKDSLLLFDHESTFGWTTEGSASVSDGNLVLGNKKATKAACTTQFPNDFELHFDILCGGTGKARLLIDGPTFEGKPKPIEVGLTQTPVYTKWQNAVIRLVDNENRADFRVNGVTIKNKEFRKDVATTVFTTNAQNLTSKDDLTRAGPSTGILFLKALDACSCQLTFQVDEGCTLSLRNIQMRLMHPKSLFNGKDLSGWKEFPGKKSKFSVTKQGWLNLKNGPGDLQSVDQWDDFALQVECVSNGSHLNSGVFFRCRPDEYQNGYEAQIRNEWTPEPKEEYAIEEYDPKTNQLVDTKKVKYTAVDYGTGGVYRRVPARREVARDHEWFTMTVIAQGRHISTWVDGIQVVDWTDNRPLKDNARNGCRLEKGPISLQGHDPTTDLNFRNFRISELPKAMKSN